MTKTEKLVLALGVVLTILAIVLVLKNMGLVFPEGIVKYHE